ncbi:MAG: MAPEG family protein [Gammaproteobacteria bacterium]|nr:MAPEG family protein [Gammaproteobacteria bacterium]
MLPELAAYHTTFVWLGILLAMIMLQWLIASYTKASQPGAIPGLPPRDAGHRSFVFRAWRTHQNTLENAGTMIGGCLFAVLVGANPSLLAILMAVMVIARILHMVLYYQIATEKNPSPRSYFFMLSWFANIGILILGFVALFN